MHCMTGTYITKFRNLEFSHTCTKKMVIIQHNRSFIHCTQSCVYTDLENVCRFDYKLQNSLFLFILSPFRIFFLLSRHFILYLFHPLFFPFLLVLSPSIAFFYISFICSSFFLYSTSFSLYFYLFSSRLFFSSPCPSFFTSNCFFYFSPSLYLFPPCATILSLFYVSTW